MLDSTPITEPGQVSPTWLTGVLRNAGVLEFGTVYSVRIASTRTLPVSRVANLRIEYSPNAHPAAPSRLFLKLSNPKAIDHERRESNYSEIEFYRRVAVEMDGPPLIKCFDTAFSPTTGESHILLEDLSGSHFQPEQDQAPSPLCSGLAVECLARFHAYWWDHPKLGIDVGKIFDAQWLDSFVKDLKESVTEFVEYLGDNLSPERRETYEQLLGSSRKIWGRLTEVEGLTVTHGDTHWWNFLYPNDPSTAETRIFDWQLWHIDLGARDLAFLVALGGFAEPRPELDGHLIRLYHDTLLANGVRNYTWPDFWDDYRWSAIRNLNIPVIFRAQGKHPTTWKNALERAFQSFDILKCSELLAG
jgi:hypothetical protein